MKTFLTCSSSIAIIFITINISYSQNSRIDFDRFQIGKEYEIVLSDGSRVYGKLFATDENTITIQTETGKRRFKKKDVEEIVSAPEIFKGDALDTGKKSIELTDGSIIKGRVTKVGSEIIEVTLVSGQVIKIKRGEIERVEDDKGVLAYGVDPNISRLFFAPTGRTLKQGDGYFSVAEIFFPMVAVGVTDDIMLSGGITIVPGLESQAYYFNAKGRPVHVKDFDLSAGVLYANETSGDVNGIGALYLTGTYGDERKAVTFGGGYGFETKGGVADYPMLILGGEIQMSKSIKAVSENWLITGDESGGVMSFGIRFFGRNLSADFALMYLFTESGGTVSGWPFIPWIGLNYNF
jgi:preprotein translocase subunit YajC